MQKLDDKNQVDTEIYMNKHEEDWDSSLNKRIFLVYKAVPNATIVNIILNIILLLFDKYLHGGYLAGFLVYLLF